MHLLTATNVTLLTATHVIACARALSLCLCCHRARTRTRAHTRTAATAARVAIARAAMQILRIFSDLSSLTSSSQVNLASRTPEIVTHIRRNLDICKEISKSAQRDLGRSPKRSRKEAYICHQKKFCQNFCVCVCAPCVQIEQKRYCNTMLYDSYTFVQVAQDPSVFTGVTSLCIWIGNNE